MTSLANAARAEKVPWGWFVGAGLVALVIAALAAPNLHRSRMEVDRAVVNQRSMAEPLALSYDNTAAVKAKPAAVSVALQEAAEPASPNASAGRKIVRTSSLEMVVKNPAEMADRIGALAEGFGGYLVSSEGGGRNASGASLTIRVPAARFEQARAEIRKLGLRVETEKIDAQDVTRQYVDEDANLRNLRAEEAQYLTILKQAHTVKDLLAVSEKLSEVRGQIEQQQAEFNALSQQVETVAMTISLRTEAEAQVFGLNWRPLYQLKLALRDGLESLGNYAAAMTTLLFYLPAILLWTGTILLSGVGGWRLVLWVGRRWFGWKVHQTAAQA